LNLSTKPCILFNPIEVSPEYLQRFRCGQDHLTKRLDVGASGRLFFEAFNHDACLTFGRERVVSVAIRLPDSTVSAMNLQFRPLVATDLAGYLNSLLLG